MLFNVCMSMPSAFATLFMSRPKLFNNSMKSISSPVNGLCSFGQLWLHCGQVQRSINRKWQPWTHFRLPDGITDRCGLVPLNMPVWLLSLFCLLPLRRPAIPSEFRLDQLSQRFVVLSSKFYHEKKIAGYDPTEINLLGYRIFSCLSGLIIRLAYDM